MFFLSSIVFSYILSTDSEISAQKSLTTAFNLWRANSYKENKKSYINIKMHFPPFPSKN